MEIKGDRADLHVHLGDRDPEDLLNEAEKNSVGVVAVLDRGIIRTKKLTELMRMGQERSIQVIPGIESLTEVQFNGHTIPLELVGLDFDLDDPDIDRVFGPKGEVYSSKHRRKVEYQRSFLESLGLKIRRTEHNANQWDLVESGEVLDTAIRLCKIAALDEDNQEIFKSWANDMLAHLEKRPQDQEGLEAKFLFWNSFAIGQPGYKKWSLDFDTIVNTIHRADGVVVLAHPDFQHGKDESELVPLITNLFDKGIDGVEGWDAGPLDDYLDYLARRYNKLCLGGSGQDLTNYSNRKMGYGDLVTQNMYIPINRCLEIARYKEIRKSASKN